MSPVREQEFEDLLGFLEFHHEHVRKQPTASVPELNLRSIVDGIAREHGRSKALAGVRQAVNDVLEELSHFRPEDIKAVDNALRAEGLVTLSALRRRYSSAYKKILKRGSIKTSTEYYLVNGLMVDLTSEISPQEREELQAMLDSYES